MEISVGHLSEDVEGSVKYRATLQAGHVMTAIHTQMLFKAMGPNEIVRRVSVEGRGEFRTLSP